MTNKKNAVTNIDAEKTTGTRETRSASEIKMEAKRLDYAMDLGLIGFIDDCALNYETYEIQKREDRAKALEYIEKDETVPQELLKRILKYKAEDEARFKGTIVK